MAPRKSKGKQKEDATDKNTFKLDLRPVQAKIYGDEQAAKIQQLDAGLEKAKIGIGKINLLEIENKPIFGTYNDRPQKSTEVNKMLTSFEKNGIQSCKEVNTLAVVIEASRIEPNQKLDGSWSNAETLVNVKFTDKHPIILASGQHRYAALKKMEETYREDEKVIEKRLARLQALATKSDEDVDEHIELRKVLSEIKGQLCGMGVWGVTLYDKDMIDSNNRELGHHLSRNQALHVYNETQEELLVSTLRNMGDAYHEGGEAAALKDLEALLDKQSHEKSVDSKLMKIFKNSRLMLTLMRDVLPMGKHFRQRRELTVRWLAQEMDVVMGMYTIYMSNSVHAYRLLASKDEFPPYRTISGLIEDLEGEEEEAETAIEKLIELRQKIMQGTPGSEKTLATYLSDIDYAATQSFAAYEGVLGASTVDYLGALPTYLEKVIEALRKGFENFEGRSKEDVVWLDTILARTAVFLTPIEETYVPMPLMSGMVMDRVWKELSSVKEGYSECSRWFEVLLDTMKVYAHNSHGADDHTEALFSAIEREQGIHKDRMIQAVWRTLWDGRANTVLRLHNNMSSPDMRAVMERRPKSKDEIARKWAASTQSTKDKAANLYNVIKKHVGVGPVVIPISLLKTPGMKPLLVTGWDWQRQSVKKHAPRDAKPSIEGLMLEMEIASGYRARVLADPMVWSLRANIEELMNTHRQRSKLKAATAGSLATPPRWTYWDGVSVCEPEINIPEFIDEDVLKEQLETNRRISSENRDRDIILKLTKQIRSLALGRNTTNKKSPMSKEVAHAGNQLIKALMYSASRVRLREMVGHENVEFEPERYYVDLGIPRFKGVQDKYTTNSDVLDVLLAADDGSDVDEEQEQAPKKPQRSKKSTAVDVDEVESEDAVEVEVEDFEAPEDSPQIEEDENILDTEQQEHVPEPVKTKPRPRPVARKNKQRVDPLPGDDPRNLFMSADTVKPTAQRDIVDVDMSDGDHPSVRPVPDTHLGATLDAALELYDGINQIDLDASSPLSSPTDLQPSMDDTRSADNNIHMVTDHELAAELDARDPNPAFSARPKHVSAPRAAPAPIPSSSKPKSRRAQSGLASGSVRSSIAPSEASYISKRSRDDSGIKSPDNKKKHKASTVRRQSEHADSELVNIHPDM
ncbi:hypothetical protein BDR05DRAFT_1006689 [Suillus weaverae]|nr:hypothetical protein BDR05DRAFT_1006689 [Suillus weaverae]